MNYYILFAIIWIITGVSCLLYDYKKSYGQVTLLDLIFCLPAGSIMGILVPVVLLLSKIKDSKLF